MTSAMMKGGFIGEVSGVSACIIEIRKTAFKIFCQRKRMRANTGFEMPLITNNRTA